MKPPSPRMLLLALPVLALAPLPTDATPLAAAPTPYAASGTEGEETDLYSFAYAYPATAGRIPKLRALLEAERREARRELIASARSEQQELAAAGIEYRPLSYSKGWDVVADLPAWLSLSAVESTYEGGAHPNHGFDAMVWDKRARVGREPIDLFTPAAFASAVKQRVCAELDRQRAEKRGGEVIGAPGDWMNTCLDPVKGATLILGSSNRRSFDRIGFLIAPYAAGPYAEGDYEITLPVDRAILAAVRPAFRSAFSLGR